MIRNPLLILVLVCSVSITLFGQSDYWIPVNGPEGGAIGRINKTPGGILFAQGDYYDERHSLWIYDEQMLHWERRSLPKHTSYPVIVDTQDRFYVKGGDSWQEGIQYLFSVDYGETWNPFSDLSNEISSLIPSNDGSHYAIMDSSLYVTLNDGTNWTKILDIPDYWAFRIDLDDFGRVFIRDSENSVMISVDHGTNWIRSALTNNDGWSSIGNPLIDPVGNIYYFSSASRDRSIYKSSDGGVNWSKIPFDFDLNRVMMNPSTGTFYALTYDSDFFRSTDQGESWTTLEYPNSLGYFENLIFQETDLYLLDSERRIYHSQNEGNSWTYTGEVPEYSYIRHTDQNGSLYAGSNGSEGIQHSSDYGMTWQSHNQGLQNVTMENVTMDINKRLYGMNYNWHSKSHHVSDDWGMNWNRETLEDSLRYLRIAPDGIFYAVKGGGYFNSDIMFSTDQGENWQKIQWPFESKPNHYFLEKSGSITAVAIGEPWHEFLYRTNDFGESWEVIETRFTDGDYSSINNFFETSRGYYMISVYDSYNWGNRTYITTDQGLTWDTLDITAHRIVEAADGSLFTTGVQTGFFYTNSSLFKSEDGGLNWQIVGEPSLDFLKLVTYYFDDYANIYAVGNDSLKVSNDGGTEWQTWSTGDLNSEIHNLSFLYTGQIIGLAKDNSIWRGSINSPLTTKESKRNKIEFRAYPNSFEDETELVYSMTSGGHVFIGIYDMHGKQVINLVDEYHKPGNYQVKWDAQNEYSQRVASGLYVAVIQTKNQKFDIKLLVK
jgi:photosystem II stability/assembly factor-like uncharacterized protein